MSNTALILPFAAPLVVSITLFILFCYLYLTYRLRFLGIWTAAWGLWSLRIGYAMYLQDMQYTHASLLLIVLALSYTTLILLGAAQFGGRRVMKIWLPLAVFGILFRVLTSSTGYEFTGFVVLVLIIGTGWIWAGLVFESSGRGIGHIRWIPAIALVAMGFHQWAIIIYQQYPDYASLPLNITLALQVIIAIGILVMFNCQARIRLTEAHAALEKSLNKVLSGFIPICANCNSIRDKQNKWSRLETYISERTDAQFTHSICQDCVSKLYPELG